MAEAAGLLGLTLEYAPRNAIRSWAVAHPISFLRENDEQKPGDTHKGE